MGLFRLLVRISMKPQRKVSHMQPRPSRISSTEAMTILSHLVLSRDPEKSLQSCDGYKELSRQDFDEMVALAHSNHVVIRGLEEYGRIVLANGDTERYQWTLSALSAERSRIANAVSWITTIFDKLSVDGVKVTVMKSLDHWPDFGSDIDLYTNSSPEAVILAMHRHFGATIAQRSWGDRLAGKWNFNIPGLDEPVEVHAGRLGQTGEQLALGSTLPARSRILEFDGQTLPVPSPSDRIMISTLQRMYRHFYFRLCDMVDSAGLANSGLLDYEDLRTAALAAGIWEGVATYLVLVADYVRRYDGVEVILPTFVKEAARFRGDVMYLGGSFLRVPILPQAASLYRTQLAGLLVRREIHSSLRLGILPFLASAAAVGHKLTGSDKGIW
jgi:hypothetical protein